MVRIGSCFDNAAEAFCSSLEWDDRRHPRASKCPACRRGQPESSSHARTWRCGVAFGRCRRQPAARARAPRHDGHDSQRRHLIARDAPIELATEVNAFLGNPRVRRRRIDEFLTRSDTGSTAHPGGTLLSHLHRTAETLVSWRAPDWLVDAARPHAAYGTDGHPHPVRGADRTTLVALAGTRTEVFVARYCNCDRQDSYPTFLTDAPSTRDRHTGRRTPLTGTELGAFAELTIANELDVFAHDPDMATQHSDATAKLFQSWLPLLSEPARRRPNLGDQTDVTRGTQSRGDPVLVTLRATILVRDVRSVTCGHGNSS